MMIPVEITIPAIYLMFSKVHMLNTYSVQIFPGIANVFCLFMLKKYMDSLPDSLLEAARLTEQEISYLSEGGAAFGVPGYRCSGDFDISWKME